MDSHIVKVRLDNSVIDSKFFMYVYDKDYSDIVFSQIQLEKKGSIMDGLNSTIIKNFFLPTPPLREQKAIVSFLDDKTAEIDEQISLQEQQIRLIDELKQSIISQAVTGKIKVI
jgi:type I restriction enzyme S subunit